jgi:alanine racemase
MTRPIQARIDLAALTHNLDRARALAGDSRVMAVVKADGYGHGLARCVRAFDAADGFGLLTLEEALGRRRDGVTRPLCLLEGFFHADELAPLAQHGIAPVVHHAWQLEALAQCSVDGLKVWIKHDSGMHRVGFRDADLPAVVDRIQSLPGVHIDGFMSHLACADETDRGETGQQLEQFTAACGHYGRPLSLAKSAALTAWPDTRLDWVRPGIMLYGAAPVAGRSAAELGLRPAMTLQSALIAVNHCRAGDAIGYGGSWRCPEDMPVGVVACGYGDGYPRHAPAGTPVLVGGARAPLVGRVSMDMITVDLRGHSQAAVGDPVVLWGGGLPVEEVATASGTISYELLCRVTARVPRVEV